VIDSSERNPDYDCAARIDQSARGLNRHSSRYIMQTRFALRLTLAVLCAAALAWPMAAETPTARPEEVGLSSERLKRVTELMQRHIDAHTFAGAVTLVARHGRVAHFDSQGLMDVAARKPMQKDAVFRIMSMTKPVAGVAVLMLLEDGKLRLTDPISKFIPELRSLQVAVPAANAVQPLAPTGATTAPLPYQIVAADREVNVRDLLTHTSGLMSGGMSNTQARGIGVQAGETLAQVLPRLAKAPLDFQPGTRWAYSAQYGFDVLVRVVEVASGMPFDRFARQRIFDPLEMKDTRFYPADGDPRIATLYQRADEGLRPQPNPAFMNGAYFSGGGGLLSTAADYLQFAQMLLNGGQLNGRRLLGPKVVELMTSVFASESLPGRVPGEGFGLSVRVVDNPAARSTLLSKGSFGWSGAFNTHFFIDPKEQVVGIFMTQVANLESRGEIRNDFETAVMQAIVGPGSRAGTN
jgi:CubicO group peptidase (beta-lactamase class C family)